MDDADSVRCARIRLVNGRRFHVAHVLYLDEQAGGNPLGVSKQHHGGKTANVTALFVAETVSRSNHVFAPGEQLVEALIDPVDLVWLYDVADVLM